MTNNDYIQLVLRTEPEFAKSKFCRITHAILGCVTEAGELADALKRHDFYLKEYDEVNLKEEAGDLLWYIAILCKALGCSFEELMEMNINKLKKRYPDKFTTKEALNRNLEEERKELEK